jgi:hypothetical protein
MGYMHVLLLMTPPSTAWTPPHALRGEGKKKLTVPHHSVVNFSCLPAG